MCGVCVCAAADGVNVSVMVVVHAVVFCKVVGRRSHVGLWWSREVMGLRLGLECCSSLTQVGRQALWWCWEVWRGAYLCRKVELVGRRCEGWRDGRGHGGGCKGVGVVDLGCCASCVESCLLCPEGGEVCCDAGLCDAEVKVENVEQLLLHEVDLGQREEACVSLPVHVLG